jgi:hypothetical protein
LKFRIAEPGDGKDPGDETSAIPEPDHWIRFARGERDWRKLGEPWRYPPLKFRIAEPGDGKDPGDETSAIPEPDQSPGFITITAPTHPEPSEVAP